MTVRHPGISPTNDLVAKKIFSNPEITCQFYPRYAGFTSKNVTILEGSNIHVLPSIPYSAQDFYTSIDVLAELDNGTQVIIEIKWHHQNFSLIVCGLTRVVRSIKTSKNSPARGNTHQSYKTSHQYMLSQSWIAIISQMI